MLDPSAFIQLTLDLTSSLGTADRYRRLLDTVRQVLPCDAAALLRLEQRGALVAVATHGLRDEVLGQRFLLDEHPRLEAICLAEGVVAFPHDTSLADPFDGLLQSHSSSLAHVHACLGCALRVDGELVGVLTADALDPLAFRGLDLDTVRALGALAGATLRTSELIAALEMHALRERVPVKALVNRIRNTTQSLVGKSAVHWQLRSEIDLVGPSDLAVLVTGETGVGKELVVRALHQASPRASRPLVQVNCAALPESLVESELFGHVRGAFTGAQSDRVGKIQHADGATLFLDEIGELPLSVQPKLLRAIQQGEIQRVGSDLVTRVDVRVLTATNRDLAEDVRAGRFRPDLYHRLAVYPLRVAPLRERLEDIPILVGHFVDQARSRIGASKMRVTEETLVRLAQYGWPGNVRELENVVSRAVLRANARARPNEAVIVDIADLGSDLLDTLEEGAPLEGPSFKSVPSQLGNGPSPDTVTVRGSPELTDGSMLEVQVPFNRSLREAVDAFQRGLIETTVRAVGGNYSEAARRLKLNRANLHHLATRLGLK